MQLTWNKYMLIKVHKIRCGHIQNCTSFCNIFLASFLGFLFVPGFTLHVTRIICHLLFDTAPHNDESYNQKTIYGHTNTYKINTFSNTYTNADTHTHIPIL